MKMRMKGVDAVVMIDLGATQFHFTLLDLNTEHTSFIHSGL